MNSATHLRATAQDVDRSLLCAVQTRERESNIHGHTIRMTPLQFKPLPFEGGRIQGKV